MGIQSPFGVDSSSSLIVDKVLGNAYTVVRGVYDKLDEIAYLAEHTGAILEAGNAALTAVANQQFISEEIAEATAASTAAVEASEAAEVAANTATDTLASILDAKLEFYPSIEQFRLPGYTDQQTFNAAANQSVTTGVTIDVPYRDTAYALTTNLVQAAKFSFSSGASVSNLQLAAATGTGGGYVAFEKSRLVSAQILGQEQIESLAYTPGRNLLNNWCFAIWQRLDVLGGSSVTAPSPTYGDAVTYSGFGGRRIYGPDMWWGKMWSGAYNPAEPITNPGGGNLVLERVPYSNTGDIGSPYYLRATFTGYNPNNKYSTPPQVYTDPVHGPNTDIGTNSVEIGRTIRGARRYGKMTFKLRVRWLSGDSSIAVRLTYNFGAGGSPNVTVNLQSFALNMDGEVHDYFVNFNIPDLNLDGYGNPISMGTPETDYVTLSIASGDNDNFSYDIFAVGLYRGWGYFNWERYDYYRDLISCQQEFCYVKAAYAGYTVAGYSFGGDVQFPLGNMRSNPTIKLQTIDYNVGAFSARIASITKTSGGFNYTTPPTITISGGATATCTISGGSVDTISITDPGSMYSTAPTVTFSGGGGYGASATASLMDSAQAVDRYGAQWWMNAAVTNNNSRIAVKLSCDGQVVKS